MAKLWTTFLILSFNLVTLNSFTGFELAWYKPVWATLSTFLFASLAWVFSPWLFVPAVQMWATGLLMVNFPDWCFPDLRQSPGGWRSWALPSTCGVTNRSGG